jgi:lysophospholipase L1-like esterase
MIVGVGARRRQARNLGNPAAKGGRVNRRVGAVVVFAGVAAACASAPTCAATAQSSDANASQPRGPNGEACATEPAHLNSDKRVRALFSAVPIEDPSGRAMLGFHTALHAAEENKGQARIVFYGASHVAADIYTDVLRTRLQNRFGEAGAGFAHPARPLPHYHHPSLYFENSTGWTGVHVKASSPEPDHYGLAGMYVVSAGRRSGRSAFTTKAHAGLTGFASELDLYYWKQPAGGHLRLSIDGKPHEIATASPSAGPGYEHFSMADGPHRFEFFTHGDGPVRLFGISLERSNPGVILDTLGIPGARAANHLLWEDSLYREQLALRKPNLVVLAYGTNESGDDGQPIEEYAADLRRVVARVRQVAPQASCLLIGPSDRPHPTDEGSYIDRPRTAQIVSTQRQVSAEFGCGFFDMVAFMGGPMSMIHWCREEPPLGASDHVHFTQRGYETFGNVLYEALLAGYSSSARRPITTPLVFGPRPIAPPGSTLDELGPGASSERPPHVAAPQPVRARAISASPSTRQSP